MSDENKDAPKPDQDEVAYDKTPIYALSSFTRQWPRLVADLHRVVVRADQRGRGIGRRLLRAGIDWAHATGAEEVLLEVEVDNAPARGLYDRDRV